MTILNAFYARLSGKRVVLLLLPLLVIIGLEITTTSLIPYTRKLVIDSLTLMDWNGFLLATFCALSNSMVLNGVQSLKTWMGQKLAFVAREALMKTIKKDWINRDGKTKLTNPCARLNDDARIATEEAISVGVEVIISVCIVLSLLISIVKWPTLLITAIIYSIISISVAALFRKPMIEKQYLLSNAEGQHRRALTRISWQQGDFTSKGRWETLRKAYSEYIRICRNYRFFNAFQNALMFTLPFWIMAPAFFAHTITLGDVTQGTLTFDLLVINSTIWVQLYPTITGVQTAFLRVKEMYEEVHEK